LQDKAKSYWTMIMMMMMMMVVVVVAMKRVKCQ
jgi:Mg2+ and Co2+ transporter CorA